MTTTQMWIIGLVVTLIAGGAMGAVLNNIFLARRTRQQPVGFTLEIIDIFRKGENFPKLAELSVIEHPLGFAEKRSVDNFSLARITVRNQGNQDFEKFSFGVTLEGDNKAADLRFDGPDRHHVITMGLPGFDMDAELKEPVAAIDFYLEPFNRRDTYTMDIYFTYEKNRGEIKLGSTHPIRFVEIGATSDRAKDLAIRLLTEMVRKGLPGF